MDDEIAEIILEFCDEVDALAQELMLQDNQVAGKHYAAMRLTLKKRFGIKWPADAPRGQVGEQVPERATESQLIN